MVIRLIYGSDAIDSGLLDQIKQSLSEKGIIPEEITGQTDLKHADVWDEALNIFVTSKGFYEECLEQYKLIMDVKTIATAGEQKILPLWIERPDYIRKNQSAMLFSSLWMSLGFPQNRWEEGSGLVDSQNQTEFFQKFCDIVLRLIDA